MTTIQVNRQALTNGDLPNLCICCGMPAVQKDELKFRYSPTWALMLNMLPGRMRWLTFGEVTFPTPLCHEHIKRFWLPFKIKMGMLAVMLLGMACVPIGFLFLVALAAAGFGPLGIVFLAFFPLALVTVLALNCVAFYTEFHTPRVVKIESGFVNLEPVALQFAESMNSSTGVILERDMGAKNKWRMLGVLTLSAVPGFFLLMCSGCIVGVFGLVSWPSLNGGEKAKQQQVAGNDLENQTNRENENRSNRGQQVRPRDQNNSGNQNSGNQNTQTPSQSTGPKRPESVDEAMTQLQSSDDAEANLAYDFLRRNQSEAMSVQQMELTLIPLMDDARRGRQAAELLERSAPDELAPQLLAYVSKSDGNEEFQRRMMNRVSRVQTLDISAVEDELIALLDDQRFGRQAHELLLKFAGAEQESAMIDYVSTATDNGDYRRRMIQKLGQLKSEAAIPTLVKVFSDRNMRSTAGQALREIGPVAAPQMVHFFHSSDRDIRGQTRTLFNDWENPPELLLPQSVKDLNSEDAETQKAAAEWLANVSEEFATTNDTYRPAVATALNPLFADPQTRSLAMRGFDRWGGKENIPPMLELLKGEDNFLWRDVADKLAGLQVSEVAPQIAQGLVNFFRRGNAAQSLRKMGPIAASAVVPLLNNEDHRVVQVACEVLKDIGTKAEVRALQKTLGIAQRINKSNVVSAAEQAIAAASQRDAVEAAAPAVVGDGKTRTWIDATGEHRIVARFIDYVGGKAVLEKENGERISLSLSQLSVEDRNYVRTRIEE